MGEITITLPDGSKRSVAEGSTVGDLAASIGRGLAKASLIGMVNGVERDLVWPLADGDEVAVITETSERGLYTIRHSTAHVLAQAVLDLFPGATFAIGPPVEAGFYYDFALPPGPDGSPGTFNPDDLTAIEARMREIIDESQPFVRDEIPSDDARVLFKDHPFKLEIIDGEAEDPTSATEAGLVRTYENPSEVKEARGESSFVDLCRGPHVAHTRRLGHFKLMRIAGAYWRGDERNPMLQRIYGTAWATKKDLDDHLHQLEEAAKRDHRKLGAELDLFSFPDEIGSGLAVFHPKGGTVRRLMEDHSRRRHEAAGYEFVNSPHITKAELFETSGHLDWFAEGMFPPMKLDEGPGGGGGTEYYLKPMNCPFHVLIYRSRQRSYRELPLRLFEFGTVYRYEKSGVVHGLTRVRGLTQDDAHIFCSREQMAGELSSALTFVLGLLRDYGLDDFYLELSTRPEGKAVGSDEEWAEATQALRAAAEAMDLDLVLDEGGGAFYGPKISVQARDAIGRTWQMSTIQLDFQTPKRFGIDYIGPDGQRHQPIMIHRALFGSVERFFAVLLEHYAGAFPTWLAPVQARVLPVRDDHGAYAAEVAGELTARGLRIDLVEATEKLGNRIRKAKGEKIPYVLVVGDDDVAERTVGVNSRGEGSGDVQRGVPLDTFAQQVLDEVADRAAGRPAGRPAGRTTAEAPVR